MKEEVKRWWGKAERDLNTAKYLFEGEKYEESSLFCQQAVEKGLKALLLKEKSKLIKTHDLVKLGKEVNLNKDLLKDCERLSIVYVDSRYPDTGTKTYTSEESSEDIKVTKRIFKWIRKQL